MITPQELSWLLPYNNLLEYKTRVICKFISHCWRCTEFMLSQVCSSEKCVSVDRLDSSAPHFAALYKSAYIVTFGETQCEHFICSKVHLSGSCNFFFPVFYICYIKHSLSSYWQPLAFQ